VMYNGDVLT